MGKIFGINGYGKLQLGFPVNINDCDIKTFTVAADAPEAGIPFGALLTYGTKTQVYSTPDELDSGLTAAKVAGIAVGTNVLLDRTFPQSDNGDAFARGTSGGCLKRAEIAVKLTGDAPAEGDAVYFKVSELAFTKESSGTVALPNCIFSGVTEGNVTVVNKLY